MWGGNSPVMDPMGNPASSQLVRPVVGRPLHRSGRTDRPSPTAPISRTVIAIRHLPSHPRSPRRVRDRCRRLRRQLLGILPVVPRRAGGHLLSQPRGQRRSHPRGQRRNHPRSPRRVRDRCRRLQPQLRGILREVRRRAGGYLLSQPRNPRRSPSPRRVRDRCRRLRRQPLGILREVRRRAGGHPLSHPRNRRHLRSHPCSHPLVKPVSPQDPLVARMTSSRTPLPRSRPGRS